jgi:hypothetical protein
MARRHNGEGSIYPYRNGYAAHVWITTPEGRRQRKSVYGKTREVVHEKWLKLHEQARRGPVAPSSPTLSAYLEGWLRDVVRPNLAPQTVVNYELFVRRYIVPGLGRKKVDKLTVRDVQGWLNQVRSTCQCCAQGKDAARDVPRCCAAGACCQQLPSEWTVHQAWTVLRGALTNAMRDELVPRNTRPQVRGFLDELVECGDELGPCCLSANEQQASGPEAGRRQFLADAGDTPVIDPCADVVLLAVRDLGDHQAHTLRWRGLAVDQLLDHLRPVERVAVGDEEVGSDHPITDPPQRAERAIGLEERVVGRVGEVAPGSRDPIVNLASEVARDDSRLRHAPGAFEGGQLAIQQRGPVTEIEQDLGRVLGQRPQTRAHPGGEDEGLDSRCRHVSSIHVVWASGSASGDPLRAQPESGPEGRGCRFPEGDRSATWGSVALPQ